MNVIEELTFKPGEVIAKTTIHRSDVSYFISLVQTNRKRVRLMVLEYKKEQHKRLNGFVEAPKNVYKISRKMDKTLLDSEVGISEFGRLAKGLRSGKDISELNIRDEKKRRKILNRVEDNLEIAKEFADTKLKSYGLSEIEKEDVLDIIVRERNNCLSYRKISFLLRRKYGMKIVDLTVSRLYQNECVLRGIDPIRNLYK